jgi:hypothetical protein
MCPLDNVAMTSVSHKNKPSSTLEERESGATMAPAMSNRAMTRRHHDQHVETQAKDSAGQTAESPKAQTPSMSTRGHAGFYMSATTLGNTPMAALTAADFYVHMRAIMSEFLNTISAKLGQTIDASREMLRESTMLIHDEIQTMSNSLKADAITNRDELSKGLKELGQHISHEVAAAIATTSEQVNNLNQASLQTIVDLLQNRSNVQMGVNSPSSFTLSNTDQNPGLGIPPGNQSNKGKTTFAELDELTNPPNPSVYRLMSKPHNLTIGDDAGPPTPGPSKAPKTPLPTWQPPPEPFSQSTLPNPPYGGDGRHRSGGSGGGRGGGGGGGRGGGPPRRDKSDTNDDDDDDNEEATDSEGNADGLDGDHQGSPLAGRATGTSGARFTRTPSTRKQP